MRIYAYMSIRGTNEFCWVLCCTTLYFLFGGGPFGLFSNLRHAINMLGHCRFQVRDKVTTRHKYDKAPTFAKIRCACKHLEPRANWQKKKD